MKKKILFTLIPLVFLLGSCKEHAGEEKKPGTKEGLAVYTVSKTEPDEHFLNAETDFVKKEYDKASEELLKAIKYMELLKESAQSNDRQAIQNSIDELTDLINNVRFDKLDGLSELQFYFARAGKALGTHHAIVAVNLIADERGEEAIDHIQAALKQYKNLVKYSGGVLAADEEQELNEIRKLTETYKKEAPSEWDTLKKSADNLYYKFEKWGQ